MIVITDSNIFFSALIRPEWINAQILSERKRIQILVPDYLIEEVYEHIDNLSKRLKKTKKQLKKEFHLLLDDIKILHTESITDENLEKAEQIVKDIDFDDAPFIAFHLQYKHKIWTGDKVLINGLKEKGLDICVTTEELILKRYKKL